MLTFGVNINCLIKSVTFSKLVDEVGGTFLIAEKVNKFLSTFLQMQKASLLLIPLLSFVLLVPKLYTDTILSMVLNT